MKIGAGRNEADLVTGAMAKFDPLFQAVIWGDPRTIPVQQFSAQVLDAEKYFRSNVLAKLSGQYRDVVETADWYLNGQTPNPSGSLLNFWHAKNALQRASQAQAIPAPVMAAPPAAADPGNMAPVPYAGGTYQDESGTIYYGTPTPFVSNGQQDSGWSGVVKDVIGLFQSKPSLIPPAAPNGSSLPVQSVQAPQSNGAPLLLIGGGLLLILWAASSKTNKRY